MAIVTRTTKVVKIIPSRGYGNALFQIVKYGEHTCTVRPMESDMKSFDIYTAHLIVDVETAAASRLLTNKIGASRTR